MKRIEPSAVLLVLSCLILLGAAFIPYLTTHYAFAPQGDTINLTGPMFCEFSKRSFANLLDWSTFEPTFYSPHLTPYYPLYLTQILDFCTPFEAAQSQDVISILHISIFFVFIVLMGRICHLAYSWSVLFAFFATVSVELVKLAVFPTISAPTAWLPLGICGLLLIFVNERFLLGILALVTGSVLMLMASPGTNMLAPLTYFGIVIGLEAGLRWALKGEWRKLGQSACAIIASGLAILGLSLSSTINLLLHLDEFIRYTRTGVVIGRSGSAQPTEILADMANWSDLSEILVPTLRYPVLGSFEVGPILIALAAFTLILRWRERGVRLFGLLALTSFVIAFILPARVLLVWNYIPGLSHTRHLGLVSVAFVIGISFLATRASRDLSCNASDKSVAIAIATASIAFGLFCLAWPPASGALRLPPILYWTATVVGILAVGILALASKFGLRFAPLVIVIAIAQFVVVTSNVNFHRFDGTPEITKTAIWADLRESLDWIRANDIEPGRILFDPSMQSKVPGAYTPGIAAVYAGLPTFDFYASPRIYWKMMAEAYSADSARYGDLAAKYVLSVAPLLGELFEKVHTRGEITVYRNLEAKSWVSLVCLGTPIPSEIVRRKSEPGRLASLPDDLTLQVLDKSKACQDDYMPSIEWLRDRGEIRWSVSNSSIDRYLVIALPPYRDWTLRIGDQEIPLWNLQDNRMVAIIPAGVGGQTRLEFRPRRYYELCAISAGFAIILIGLWSVAFFRERSTPSIHRPTRVEAIEGNLM